MSDKMNQSFKLYRLQQLDSQIDRVTSRLQQIQIALNDHRAIEQAEKNSIEASNALESSRKALRKAEGAVKDQRIKIETTESTLYGGKVRNPKELQDLQNEAAALSRYLSVLEDRQLDAMLEEETAVDVDREAKIALELAQAKDAGEQSRLAEEQGRLLKDLSHLQEERQAAAGSIPSGDISMYESLRKTRRGVAVSLVKDKTCSACGTTLSATLFDAALKSDQLSRCEGCGRILYVG
jgi:predicted  nucleic acid-binding Zn-ribbon protein